ncbi:MAG: 16S rRNA (cytidine(1402)-2'-O)-methyltransferase [Pseudohongiella sp.]|nr:16S rRNA (cytidine(1402)-2'-O)-methyltransferase [Pseudohongiella sp.]MDO9520870.1 16S rRNA (cytidine(1402)-2'-O)-methyltransferase [Pseudohongiella sp.]MDP2128067.1 16S rRNA (cytidine(1402)-2'-O)-methyltransferase [Pseudohongiella sp.]
MANQTADGSVAALYIVATPIGNLGDISQRALDVLRQADLIAAEDTRHSSRLTQHFGITTRLVSYHDFSSSAREDAILADLQAGRTVALISDAGTPLISDPGYSLVLRARQLSIPVIPIPGACALTTALCAAGLPTDRFVFEGFPAHKQGPRRQLFESLVEEQRTLIFYESPHRIADSIADMCEVFGSQRQAVICRELTKTWETIHGDNLQALCGWITADDNNRRGEFVVLVHGAAARAEEEMPAEVERQLRVLLEELPVKQAAALAARLTGLKKNALYKRALEISSAR